MTAVALDLSLLAEALFVSDLQPSTRPGTRLVEETVRAQVFHLGEVECSARVAAEFGDHPEAACCRMAWARAAVRDVFA